MSGYVRVLDMDNEAREQLAADFDETYLKQVADDILRQVVCNCGNYRHHGVHWMPEGSGEGLSVTVEILRKLVNRTK